MSIDIPSMKRLLLREIGKGGDVQYQADIELLWDYYSAVLSDPSLSLLYLHVKYHIINFILADAANKYDTQEMDVQEKESQIFDHWWKLYTQAETMLATEMAMDAGGLVIAIDTMTKTSPLPYTDLVSLYALSNPNNPAFSGMPLPYWIATT